MTTKSIREYIEQLDEISRRDFLRGAGALAAGLTLTGLAIGQDSNFPKGTSDKYPIRLANAIKPNMVWTQEVPGNPTVIVLVKTDGEGLILGVEISQPSGLRDWDEAVMKAVVRTRNLPLDVNGKSPKLIQLRWSFKDLPIQETSPEAIAKVSELTRK